MFRPLVDALHTTRLRIARERGAARPRREDAQHAVTLLNLALVAEPLVGEAFLRSVDIDPDSSAQLRFHRWLVRTIVVILLPDPN